MEILDTKDYFLNNEKISEIDQSNFSDSKLPTSYNISNINRNENISEIASEIIK